ncbi:hypothetical protein COY05_05250 [Candidatus Peregrinibacteria bacterium CG_4_10_14_0_2_um_filter_38_24]|nr:hypothetical protein [bacterium]PIZ75050.1 MAG: hypothetical protein COY05_05250 [Candidatus Peregrinibacteria bacterium CG_4_10_14_0_2_um_filter_38_24]PJC38570.1 MAG: hypothetical protein CO044_04290 [Candidatus Peregrinibacteria bacterium CG_4_9_14_0_2_um_filter_38_9]
MDRFLAIALGCPAAFLILYYRRAIREFIGNVDFAESFLGAGGTNTFVVLLGILTFILSLMYGFGALQSLLIGSFGRFF